MLQALSIPANHSLVPQGEAQSRRATAKGKSGLEGGLCSYKLCGCSKLKPFDHSHWKPPSQSKPVEPAKALTLAPRVTWPSPAPGAGSPLFATGSLLEMPAALQQPRIRKKASLRRSCISAGMSGAAHACRELSSWAATPSQREDPAALLCGDHTGRFSQHAAPGHCGVGERGWHGLKKVWGYPSVSRGVVDKRQAHGHVMQNTLGVGCCCKELAGDIV